MGTVLYVVASAPRPPFPDVAAAIWGADVDVDTDGDSSSPQDTHWTELFCSRRDQSGVQFDVSVAAERPLTLKIEASDEITATRVARFLAEHMGSQVQTAIDGTQQEEPRVLFTTGGLVDETCATLAVYGEELEPDDITAMLGCAPTSSHRRGDRRGKRSPPAKRGGWLLEHRGKRPDGPEELTAVLLDQVSKDPAVWKALVERYDVQLRLGIHITGWNRGFGLSSALVGRIAALGPSIDVDLYSYDPEEPDDDG